MIILAKIIPWLAAWFFYFVASSIARFIAFKIFMGFLFVALLPIVLNNFLHGLYSEVLAMVNQMAGTQELEAPVLQLTSLAGWMGSVLQIPEAMSLLTSAIAFRFTLRLLPFVRV